MNILLTATRPSAGAAAGCRAAISPTGFVTPDRPLSPSVREAIRTVIRATLAPYTADWAYAQVYFNR